MMTCLTRRRWWLAAAQVLALAALGCRSEAPTYPTEGEVVYSDNGEPVPGAMTIWFESTNPPYQRSVGIVKDGKFYLSTKRDGSGSIAGPHRVRFDPTVPDGGAIENPQAALGRIMHPRYLEFQTSRLKVDIEPVSKNTIKIKVDPPPGGRKKVKEPTS